MNERLFDLSNGETIVQPDANMVLQFEQLTLFDQHANDDQATQLARESISRSNISKCEIDGEPADIRAKLRRVQPKAQSLRRFRSHKLPQYVKAPFRRYWLAFAFFWSTSLSSGE